jgi:hypothetical protein
MVECSFALQIVSDPFEVYKGNVPLAALLCGRGTLCIKGGAYY